MNHKQIILFLLLIMSLRTYGQAVDSHKWDNVTIYEYGDLPLTTCESNFENLFINWPKWITNYRQTELISYKYVETLEDSMLIDYYAELLINWKSLGATIKGYTKEYSNADTTKYARGLFFYTKPLVLIPEKFNDSSKIAIYKSEMNLNIKMMRNHFKKTVHIGDKVYKIKIKTEEKEYFHYVICRPGENSVVFDMFFLRIHMLRETIDKFQ